MSLFNIDEQPKSQNAYKLHPAGIFKATIAEVKDRESKSSKGNKMFGFRYNTDEGVLFDNVNYKNANKEVEQRAMSQLADILFACGKKGSISWDEIPTACEGKEVMIRVYHSKPKEGFQAEAKIGSVMNLKNETRDGKVVKQEKQSNDDDILF